ncbi:MAG TPA: SAM-dependent methyltransferase [Candidatus Rubrimentiphilum sp.]|nr:SAM-dependent methyltransferase [Candidatus Rubrimentiphilum sp.]
MCTKASKKKGSLTVVGTGIKIGAQTSPEALACIENADKVLFLPADALTEHWLRRVNASAEPLHRFYAEDKLRNQTYQEMADYVLEHVRQGKDVCFVSYGHPGVFADPMHESVRRARTDGYAARMLPAISAEDCLFADLGVDPGRDGCQSFEATGFLVFRKSFDPGAALILWQIGVIGNLGYKSEFAAWNLPGLEVLRDYLLGFYDRSHQVAVYDAAPYVLCDSTVQYIELDHLLDAKITAMSTLYVPPKALPEPDAAMVRKLGLETLVELS